MANAAASATREIFDGMDDHSKNRFSCIAMLIVYAHNGRPLDSKNLFDRIPGGRDSVAWSYLIGAFVKIGDLEHARHVFDLLPRWTVVTSTAIVVALAKRGKAEDARAIGQDEALAKKVFDSKPQREVVSRSGRVEEARAAGLEHRLVEPDDPGVRGLSPGGRSQGALPSSEHDFVSCTAYSQTSQIFLAKAAVDRIPQRDVVSCQSLNQLRLFSAATKKVFPHRDTRDVDDVRRIQKRTQANEVSNCE
ncbi:pentatricopeptide repeat-containing protein At2g35030, mitochondrial-like [Selaginella moellendorffii]|uniref:pentatricopeptide repeat-containing protein At2g35030, mitochondrial-like n=1 Tax=Selaginella moellendorffii TaxID=88036 RepID=UPI000D1C3F1C|nr:pentatricopeptide repeat-containing protein At2g35030, mitochondrial-like [Selaginella moellendorffii]|eukprot:XP_024529872.1 pentatricopeptide repeat-containing protein At2g35030, mitochondrial-like [Selaginella moellendorffii]